MKCDECGNELVIGDWPYCPHGPSTMRSGFEPYFDIGLGVYVTDPGDRNKAMRPKWVDDHIEKLEPRDKPAIYYKELTERRAERRARALEGKL